MPFPCCFAEPFPPTLGRYKEYARGTDLLILKNEEDPQYNIWCPWAAAPGGLSASLSASMISAEGEEAPSFADGVVTDWVYPYVEALRFATVHPGPRSEHGAGRHRVMAPMTHGGFPTGLVVPVSY
jgi:hypothetical protein